MKMLPLIAVLLSAFMTSPSFAKEKMGAGSSGGGNAIVCKTNAGEIKSIQLLDHFEGNVTMNAKLDMGDPSKGYMVMITHVLNRLSEHDPVTAARLLDHAQKFEDEMSLLDPSQMRAISDSNEVFNPGTNCFKIQFVVQVMPPKQFEKRYYVNRELWNSADDITKAGLVLHEVIYRDAALKFGQTNSDGSRYYNYLISSTKMASLSSKDYESLVKQSGFIYEPTSNDIELNRKNDCLFTSVKDTIPVCIATNWAGGHDDQAWVLPYNITYQMQDGTEVELYGDTVKIDKKSGKLLEATLAKQTEFTVAGQKIMGREHSLFSLHNDGTINELITGDVIRFETSVGTLDAKGRIVFSPNGQLISAIFNPAIVTLAGQKTEAKGEITFFENGAIKSLSNIRGGITLPLASGGTLKLPLRKLHMYLDHFPGMEKASYNIIFDEMGRVTNP